MVTLEKMFREVSKTVLASSENDDLNHFSHPSGEVDKDGTRKTYKVNYSFDVLAYKGQVLDDALKSGRFSSMELVAHEFKQFDAGGNLQITQQSVLVKAGNPGNITAANLVNSLRSHLKSGPSHQYDKAKIVYKNDAGEPASATLDINDLDAAFTKRESIHFETDVEAQQNSISSTVMSQLLTIPR